METRQQRLAKSHTQGKQPSLSLFVPRASRLLPARLLNGHSSLDTAIVISLCTVHRIGPICSSICMRDQVVTRTRLPMTAHHIIFIHLVVAASAMRNVK